MKIIRVFPRKTSMTPSDELVFVGDPPLWRPEADEVHVSVTFTWDVKEAERLVQAWGQYYDVVRLGGPAVRSPCNGFEPGMYIKSGVTFTTRGCNNSCPWCLVPKSEGKLAEIEDFASGYIVQDNNLLQASWRHQMLVFDMLKAQRKAAVFSGGFQSSLITDRLCDELRCLRINSVWLAADSDTAMPPLRNAVSRLEFLGRNSNKLRCYVMIGYDGETISEATDRLEAVWEVGCVPFAQLYQPDDHRIDYSREWRMLARTWSRPAAIRAMHSDKTGTRR